MQTSVVIIAHLFPIARSCNRFLLSPPCRCLLLETAGKTRKPVCSLISRDVQGLVWMFWQILLGTYTDKHNHTVCVLIKDAAMCCTRAPPSGQWEDLEFIQFIRIKHSTQAVKVQPFIPPLLKDRPVIFLHLPVCVYAFVC